MPRSVVKPVNEIIDGLAVDPNSKGTTKAAISRGSSIPTEINGPLSAEDFKRAIAQLEDKMYAHARDLEFEAAAHVRDQIAELKRGQFHPVIAAA